MLLKGSRKITYGGVLVALGVAMALISVYTPFGKRVLFLASGLPVLTAAGVMGRRTGLAVYSATALLLLLWVNPFKAAGYLLLAGGVPLVLITPIRKVWLSGVATLLLGLTYIWISTAFFGLQTAALLARLKTWVPWMNPLGLGLGALSALSFLYPWSLRWVDREIRRHWAFKQIFKP